MRNILITISLLLSLKSVSQTFFDRVDNFLSKNVTFGLVDYGSISKSSAELDSLVNMIETHEVSDSSANYRKAFYINAYNLLVIKQVVENYPVSSPKDIEGFFNETKFTVAGDQLTLDELEFDRLLVEDKDARIHFAIACAARSCPYLYEYSFRSESLEDQLNSRAERIIQRPNYVYVDIDSKTVTLNMIFSWYADQFAPSDSELITYINQFRPDSIPTNFKINHFEYDWSLNDRVE